jgi:hypothetical protein
LLEKKGEEEEEELKVVTLTAPPVISLEREASQLFGRAFGL